MSTPFNQGVPTVPVILNTSNCFVFGNTASGNALSVQQLGTGNVASFRTASGATAMFMNAAGNVGIGTTIPSTPLDVIGRVRSTQDFMAESTATGGNYSVMRIATGSNGANYIQSGAAQSGGSAAPLVFTGWFGSPEFMRITSGGNLGIGTASPQATIGGVSGIGIVTVGAPQVQSGSDFYGNYLMLTRASSNLYASMLGHKYLASAGGSGLDFHVTDNSDVSTSAPKMTIRSSGNVGIGTTNPQTTLDSNGIVNVGTWNNVGTAADNTTYGLERSRYTIQFPSYRDTQNYKTGAKIIAINKQTYPGTTNRSAIQSTDIAFFTTPPDTYTTDSSIERMRIMDTGNVGIGTTNPIDPLQVQSTTATTRLTGTTNFTTSAFIFDNRLGAYWHLNGYGNNPTTSARGAAYAAGQIICGSETNNNYENSYMAFQVCYDPQSDGTGGLGVTTERMRIKSNGNVGIGTTTPGSYLEISATGANHAANGTLRFYRSDASTLWKFTGPDTGNTLYLQNAGGTGVYITNGSTTWTGTSDSRLKNIIGPISNALTKVNLLNPVMYSWKNDETNDHHPGLIAQDVLKVQPEAVSTNSEGMYGVAYTELIPLAFAAIKELSEENTALKARLDALETRLGPV